MNCTIARHDKSPDHRGNFRGRPMKMLIPSLLPWFLKMREIQSCFTFSRVCAMIFTDDFFDHPRDAVNSKPKPL